MTPGAAAPRGTTAPARAPLVALVALAAVGAMAGLGSVRPVAAQEPTSAPATTLSADGRTVSGAGKALQAAQVHGLDPAGQSVTVQGTGYDEHKGVYVTFCVIPPPDHPPTPCGGGQDRDGSSSASSWISSNPPAYATGLTTPYGPGGSFTTTVALQPVIADGIDCRVVRCAIVTRNDHTRGSDRSQDLFLPVTFRDPARQPPPTAPAPPLPPPTVPATVPDPAAQAPPATVAPDGTSASDGERTLASSATSGLDPSGAALTVAGAGFDPGQGIYVALCRVPEPGAPPGPCTAGGAASAWVSSDPPDYGRDVAVPFAEGGRFEVELRVGARIDASTDCREVACAIATRSDDTAPADRRNDLLVPVSFDDEPPATSTVPPAAGGRARTPEGGGGGNGVAVAALASTGLLGAGLVAALTVRTRRRGTPAGPTREGPA